jgi:hypothetical protein
MQTSTKAAQGLIPTEVQALAPLRDARQAGKLLALSDASEGV